MGGIDKRLIGGRDLPVLAVSVPFQGICPVVVIERARLDLASHHGDDIRSRIEMQPAVTRLSGIPLVWGRL